MFFVEVTSLESQQEPRLLSAYSNDLNMINAYKQGKDLYATIASGVYHNEYWDNMEHHQDGSPNPDGKKRRSACKSILLGIMYGRGATAIAEQINSTKEEAQQIIDNFYQSFPSVKKWMDDVLNNAKKNGYVEDLWGRRRRLPDILLPPYELSIQNKNELDIRNFNPFIECSNRVDISLNKKMKEYVKKLELTKYRNDIFKIKEDALKNGIEIRLNYNLIAQAERQCVNACIQGSASTMTKIAMNKIHGDKILKDLDFTLLIGVHDELIGECPMENVDKVSERLTYLMKTCVDDVIAVPFKCDADICSHWYFNDYSEELKKEYNKLLKEMSTIEAFEKIVNEHIELTREQLNDILGG